MKKVVKFGGSSLANAEQYKKVGAIIKSDPDRKFAVPSAPGKRFSGDIKVTDLLYVCYAAAEADEDFRDKLAEIKSRYDEIIEGLGMDFSLDEEFRTIAENFKAKIGVNYAASRGEYLNGKLMAAYLGYEFVDAAEVVRFDNKGNYDEKTTYRLMRKRLKGCENAVIPGFYGSYADGRIKTFSRGGSDVTGSIVAGAVEADLYENWTDVSGFLVADPNIVKNPEGVDVITYRELRELSYMGASVLHEEAIFPVRKAGIPINIRNTNRPEDKGTMIVSTTSYRSKHTITGIAGKKGFVAMTIEKDMMNSDVGFARKVLEVFEDHHISVEHTPTGIDTMCVFVHQDQFQENEQAVISDIQRAVDPDEMEVEGDLALIAVVGRSMKDAPGTAGRICAALAYAKINIKMIDQGSSELNIIVGVRNEDFDDAIRAIYDVFVSSELPERK